MPIKPVSVGYTMMKHVFDVLGLETSVLDNMYDKGISGPLSFIMAFNDLDELMEECTKEYSLSKFESKDLGRAWLMMATYLSKEKSMPKTVDEFKAKVFNEDFYKEFILREFAKRTPKSKPKLTVKTTTQASSPAPLTMGSARSGGTTATAGSTTGTTNFKISLSDFPTFDGNQSNWLPFKKEVISVMALMQRSDLTQQKSDQELQAHDQLMTTDQAYYQHVIELHAILMKKTAKGLAASMIEAHMTDQDGVRAWNDMCSYYDNGGNKELQATTAMTALMNLRLEAHSHGGYENYVSKFTQWELELERAGTTVDELVLKTMFLNGIVDPAYSSVKDDCRDADLKTTKQTIRLKAQTLNALHSPMARKSRQNTKKQGKGGKKNNNSTTKDSSQMHFPKEVWDKMDPEVKKWIRENKSKSKNNYGLQYSNHNNNQGNNQNNQKGNNDNRRNNNVSADSPTNKEETGTEKNGQISENSPNQSIYRPRNVKQQMRRVDRIGQAVAQPDANGQALDGNQQNDENGHEDVELHDVPPLEPRLPIRVDEVIPALDLGANYVPFDSDSDTTVDEDEGCDIVDMVYRENPRLRDSGDYLVKVWFPARHTYTIIQAWDMKANYPTLFSRYLLDNYQLRNFPAQPMHNATGCMRNLLIWAIRHMSNSRYLHNKISGKCETRQILHKTEILNDDEEECFLDSGADTSNIGGPAWHIKFLTERKVNVYGFDEKSGTSREDVPVGTGVTAVDLPNDETILLRVNEATVMEDSNSLLSTFQCREAGVIIDDKPLRHGGGSYLAVDDCIVPLEVRGALMGFKIRKPTAQELEELDPYELTSDVPWYPSDLVDEESDLSNYQAMQKHYENREILQQMKLTKEDNDLEQLEEFLAFPGRKTVEKTLLATTRLGFIASNLPMKSHQKSRNPNLQVRRFLEGEATDTGFATVTSYEGYNVFQLFVGLNSYYVSIYGLQSEGQGPNALLDHFRNEGVPLSMRRDNSKMQAGNIWREYLRRYWCKDEFTEPYHPHQNPAENVIGIIKEIATKLMIDSGAHPKAWFRAMSHAIDIYVHLAKQVLGWRTPVEKRYGYTPDITGLLQFKFWELVYYQNPVKEFPDDSGNEGLGRFLGRAKDYGDGMCYWILPVESEIPIVRSMVHSVNEAIENKAFAAAVAEERENDKIRQKEANCPIIVYETGEKVNESEKKNTPYVITGEDLLGLTVYDDFPTSTDKLVTRKGEVREVYPNDSVRVEFTAGKQKIYEYEELMNLINQPEEEDGEYWKFDKILKHHWSQGQVEVLVDWAGEEPTWEPLSHMKTQDPVTLAVYAHDNGLLNQSKWKWAKHYVKTKKKLDRAKKQVHLMKKRTGKAIKYMFGERVPRTLAEAYMLDKINGNTKWQDAIEKEVKLLRDLFGCFKIPKPNEITEEYQYVPLIWAFAIKFDGRARARCVASGNVTKDIKFDIYSGVVDLENVRIAFVIAALMELQVIAADVGSAYIQALTIEKMYTVLGKEFGEWEGVKVIIVKALYGLKLSSHMWWRKCADSLRKMGFRPSGADYNLWIRQAIDHYEYIAVIVDDLLVFSKEPSLILEPLKDVFNYELKGVGAPEYYSGADMRFNPETGHWEMLASTYIKNVCDKIHGYGIRLLHISLNWRQTDGYVGLCRV